MNLAISSYTADVLRAEELFQISFWVALSWTDISYFAPKHPSYLITHPSLGPWTTHLKAVTHCSHHARTIFQANTEIFQKNSLFLSLLHVARKVWNHCEIITCWAKKNKRKKKEDLFVQVVIWGLVASFIFHYLKFLLSQVNSKAFHEAFFSLQRVTMFHCLQRERVKEHPFFWIAYNPSAVPSWQCYSGLCNLQQLVQSVFRVKKAFWISSSFSIIHSWVADCLLNTNNYQCFCSI